VRDGLIPNMFPEGTREGLYHTADATLWFFHALHRYLRDRRPVHAAPAAAGLSSIVEHHSAARGSASAWIPPTACCAGAEGYQLTWMDAKVDDWVVTPRRGKAVEINALWYNALRLLEGWLARSGDPATGDMAAGPTRARIIQRALLVRRGRLSVRRVDGEQGDDPACRPNQIFAISLDHPVLDRARWEPVFEVVRDRLLTPVGLRSLAPGHRDYKRSTTATCARATPRTTRARSGAG
jgi:predicted glycogen debranching enzyme